MRLSTSTGHRSGRRRGSTTVDWAVVSVLVLIVVAGAQPTDAAGQLTATARSDATPPWNDGIQPILPASYYDAIECGTQGGDDPPCVFWDTGLCTNDDFTLATYTAYKQVAYAVWDAVRRGQPAPQPNFQAAQRTRVTIGVTPVQGSENVLTDLILTRDGAPVAPVDRNVRDRRFTWDYPAWVPTSTITLDMVGETGTISCVIEPAVLRQFR